MSNHAPAQWLVDQGEHAHFVYVDDGKTSPYTIIAYVSAKLPSSLQNLKLIAAAPEMLEALQAALKLSDDCMAADKAAGYDRERTPECQAVYDKVKAAIEKATI